MLASGHGGDQAGLTAQNDRRRGRLASRRPPLVVALRAEFVLQIVVGARQVRNAVAVKQPRAIAAVTLQKWSIASLRLSALLRWRTMAPTSPSKRRCTVAASAASWLFRMCAALCPHG